MAKPVKNEDNVTSINPADDVVPEADVPRTKLGEFEGVDVVSLSLVVKKAGDGLSAAIEVTPQTIQLGDEVTLVLQARCTKVGFKEIKDAGVLDRVVDLTTTAAAIVDEELVKGALDETQRKIDERAGVKRLPFGASDPDAPDEDSP